MTAAALELEGLSIVRETRESSLRLEVERFWLNRGEAAALTGRSGCGKSTFLDILAMVLWPDRVKRMWVRTPQGPMRDVTSVLNERLRAEAARIRAATCGYVLQTGGLLPFLTVRQNAMAADPAGLLSRKAMQDRIVDLAAKLRIAAKLDEHPGALSVGERQRAAILRALAKGPTVLLADEPTANLDPETSRKSLDLLLAAARESDSAVFVVSHDHALIRESGLPEWTLSTSEAGTGVVSCLDAPRVPGRP